MTTQTEKAPTGVGTLTTYRDQTADQATAGHDTRGIDAVLAHARAYSAALVEVLGGGLR